jgi:hypothetical protein
MDESFKQMLTGLGGFIVTGFVGWIGLTAREKVRSWNETVDVVKAMQDERKRWNTHVEECETRRAVAYAKLENSVENLKENYERIEDRIVGLDRKIDILIDKQQ